MTPTLFIYYIVVQSGVRMIQLDSKIFCAGGGDGVGGFRHGKYILINKIVGYKSCWKLMSEATPERCFRSITKLCAFDYDSDVIASETRLITKGYKVRKRLGIWLLSWE